MAVDMWDTSKGYRPSPWANMSEVGFIGGLDGDLWAGMGEGRAENEEAGGESTGTSTAKNPPGHHQTQTPSPRAPRQTSTKPKLLAPPPPPKEDQHPQDQQ